MSHDAVLWSGLRQESMLPSAGNASSRCKIGSMLDPLLPQCRSEPYLQHEVIPVCPATSCLVHHSVLMVHMVMKASPLPTL